MSLIPRLPVVVMLFVAAPALSQDFVPEDLKDWRGWVLKDKEYLECPFYFDRGATEATDYVCTWPGPLAIDVTAGAGRFTQTWAVDAKAQRIRLPGSLEHWPDQVLVDGRPVEVVREGEAPTVILAPGTHVVTGRFAWDERPGTLLVPPQSGLVTLTVDGRRVDRPELDRSGLFLGERREASQAVDSVSTVVHRLVVDDVPTRLVTRLRVDVSGGVREVLFGPVLPDGFVPLRLDSPLPARLEADGKMRLQVRPGRWFVTLAARGPGVIDEMSMPGPGDNMPATEIWSYQSNDRLRVSAAEGMPPVDPAQAEVPEDWRRFPAFRLDGDQAFTVVERSRGIVSASNELSLDRTIWLDFDGDGFVAVDRISGSMRTGWRLDMRAPYTLLTATENDENLLITKGSGGETTGVEIRSTSPALEALARVGTRASMPVTGWDARFSRVGGTLYLPPGHKLLTAPGVDTARGSWTDRWQLLDFFLLLIMTIAAWRLFGPVPGIVALSALALSFHEPFAPTWLWLNVLVAIALLRVTPEGRLRLPVRIYELVSAAALVLALVPFVAGQLRIAIYPQLEPQVDQYGLSRVSPAQLQPAADMPATLERREVAARQSLAVEAPREMAEEVVVTAMKRAPAAFARYAPNAIVQAGPGIPSWQWNRYSLDWSGPVDASQSMHLVILSRWLVSLLRVVAVMLLLGLAGILAAEIAGRQWRLPGGLNLGRAPASAAVMILAALAVMSPDAAAEIPDADILKQLEQRLTAPPDCAPRCGEIAAADVVIGGAGLEMRLSVHALEEVAVPLPGSAKGWRPEAVLVDGNGGAWIARTGPDMLWLRVPAGRHAVTIRGAVPEVDSLEIPFPSEPRVITAGGEGWLIAGIEDRRLLSGSLQLTRLQPNADGNGAPRWEASRFPAFARIERTIEFDLDWRVRTTVIRVAPEQGAMTLEVPLVDGESVISGDFTIRDGRVLVSMGQGQRAVEWRSNLEMRSPLTLSAGPGDSWQEVWRVAVGNVWNARFEGVPENESGGGGEVRVAEFNPRAGERLTVTATRPEAVEGTTLAFDSVKLAVNQGARSSDVSLALAYRSTRGAQHELRLPDDAEVTSVAIDGQPQTLRGENGRLTLPILPGEHLVVVEWRAAGGMGFRTSTPVVDIGAPSSNIDLSMTRPHDRWLLGTTGPQLGPAVLYWSELAVLALFALILGRTGLAPLRSRHWLLLGLGFSTFSWPVFGVVVVWLLVCAGRERWASDADSLLFNAMQVVIAGLTIMSLVAIVSALPMGLLGTPDMHVSGYNSYGNVLGWFADAGESVLPVATAFTVPLWIYKVLILAWALWLSFALLRWLPWVWRCFSSRGYWRSGKEVKTN